MIVLFPGAGQIVFFGIFNRPEIACINTGTTERAFGEIKFVGGQYFFLASFRLFAFQSDATGRAGLFAHAADHAERFSLLIADEFDMSTISGGHFHGLMRVMQGDVRFEEFHQGDPHPDYKAPES